MTTLFAPSATEPIQRPPALDHRLHKTAVIVYQQPLLRIASSDSRHCGAQTTGSVGQLSETTGVPRPGKLATLPVEIVNRILSDLIHPHCRLPGLTEAQSQYGFTDKQKRSIKDKEDLIQPADTDRWAVDIFSLCLISHPFNALALTSRACHRLVESYCAHLVRRCNSTMFNLPFAHLDKYGSNCVYPDLSGIVYRRLWLQHAPRKCVYCQATLDFYPFRSVNRILTACGDCFYRQTMTTDEVERQYHLSPSALALNRIRGNRSPWVLRVDVEALALQLYRTRGFHNAHPEQFDRPCLICAITRFTKPHEVNKPQPSKKIPARQAGRRARMRSTRS